VRRYLCQTCRRTVSLLPEFALPSPAIQRLFLSEWTRVWLSYQTSRNSTQAEQYPRHCEPSGIETDCFHADAPLFCGHNGHHYTRNRLAKSSHSAIIPRSQLELQPLQQGLYQA